VRARPTFLLVARVCPVRDVAGNLTYLDAILAHLETLGPEVRLLVLGDRFPRDQLVWRYAEAPARAARLSMPALRRVGPFLVLTDPRAVLKTLARRVVSALPARVRNRITGRWLRRRAGPREERPRLGPEQLAFARQELARHRPAAVFVDSLMLHDVLNVLGEPRPSTFLVMHDLVSARVATQPQEGAPDLIAADLGMDLRAEMALMAEYDHVVAIQREEADVVRRELAGRSVLYVPMPVAPAPVAHARTAVPRCLFVGSTGAGNVDALRWFLDEVWAKVRAEAPDAVLDVCGGVGGLIEGRPPGMVRHGRVPDLRPFHARADVLVVPVRGGSGMKVKLAEGLAAGCAAVSTSFGAQGLTEGAGDAFLLADTPDAFAAATLAVLRDEALRDRLRARAVAFAAEQLAPERAFRELTAALRPAMG